MLWPYLLLQVLSNAAGIIPETAVELDPISKIIGQIAEQALSKLTEESSLCQGPGRWLITFHWTGV
jgi:hypothetical protein